MAISEALIGVLSFLEEQHPFVPALIQHFPSSSIFSLFYARDFQLVALEENDHNCHGCFLFLVVNLLSSFAGDICGEAVSASAPEQLCVPVSRAMGRCLFGRVLHPARLPWQLDATSSSNGASSCLTLQSPACCWAAKDALAAQWVPQWQIKFSFLDSVQTWN